MASWGRQQEMGQPTHAQLAPEKQPAYQHDGSGGKLEVLVRSISLSSTYEALH